MFFKHTAKIFLLGITIVLLPLSVLSNNEEMKKETPTAISPSHSIPLKRSIIYHYLANYVAKNVPKSYQFIQVHYKDIKQKSKLHEDIQKLIYLNVLENSVSHLYPKSFMNSADFYILVEKILWKNIFDRAFIQSKESSVVTFEDIAYVETMLRKEIQKQETWEKNVSKQNIVVLPNNVSLEESDVYTFLIFFDAYNTLKKHHYSSTSFTTTGMIYGALEGLAKSTKDSFTTFFPPKETKEFYNFFSWKFEGIGAHVEMNTPGVLVIVAPLYNSPAQKAWLKAWDIIVSIDGVKITPSMSLEECVNRIRWKKGTSVKLEILREKETLFFEIVRDEIIIHDVEARVIGDTLYIKMNLFWEKIEQELSNTLKYVYGTGISNIIFDLRNNPGGYLEQAAKALSLFIPKNEPTIFVKYKNTQEVYSSQKQPMIDLNKYRVYALINKGTASASEIFLASLKDYFPHIQILGEKSYGKGSVQSIRNYYDGSSLKYTVARWYTGKNHTTIDQIGITPDIPLETKEKATFLKEQIEKDPWVQFILEHIQKTEKQP